jgi:hypothetical protein
MVEAQAQQQESVPPQESDCFAAETAPHTRATVRVAPREDGERVAQKAPDGRADDHGHEARGDRGPDVGERAPSPQDDAHDGGLRSQQIVEMREESGSHPSGSARIGCGAERQGAWGSYVDFGVNMNQRNLAKYPKTIT